MKDLIYAGDAEDRAKKEISEWFPHAEFEDASDMIHEGRFGVTLPDTDADKWDRFLVMTTMMEISFRMQLNMMQNDPARKEVMRKMGEFVCCISLIKGEPPNA